MGQYETASQRYYGGRNISVLVCLARSWYVKASKEQSFASMTVALQFTQKVRPTRLSFPFQEEK